MNQQQILTTAIAIAQAAGELLRQGLGERTVITSKTSAVDLVTEYDTAAEALIISRLAEAFPDHHVVAEEGGWQEAGLSANGAGHVWYVDPLDGTNNFAHGYPVFCVSLALYQGDEPLVGVIYDPTRDETFRAIAGQGAWLSTPRGERPLHVSAAPTLVESLLATGFPYDRHTNPHNNVDQAAAFLRRALGLRRAGAAALDMAYVAAGRLDGYWEFKLKPWDIGAGILLVREAGGRVTTTGGGPVQVAPVMSLVASNGRIHDAMVEVLQAVAAEKGAPHQP